MERMDFEREGYEFEEDLYGDELPVKAVRSINKKNKKEFLTKLALKREKLKYWEDVLDKEPENKQASKEVEALRSYLKKHGKGSKTKGSRHRIGKKVATGQRDQVRRPGKFIPVAEPYDPIVSAE